MFTSRLLVSLATCLAITANAHAGIEPIGVLAREAPLAEQAFPSSTALAEGVSPDSLLKLRELVQSFVDDEEIVGAELLVVKNGNAILHEGFGLKDQEQGVAMGTGNVFCVRSMTKPLIGTSILMLARIIHEHAHQTSQTVAFGSLSAPNGTLRILPSSTTRKGRLRRQNPQSTVRNRVAVSGARLHE